MELDFFEKVILPRLEQSHFFDSYEKCENKTQCIYILKIGTGYEGYEEYLIYFDKNTKNFIKIS